MTLSRSALVLVGLGILLAGLIGYGVGRGLTAGPRMSEVKVFRDAPGHVGDAQASATGDGTTYGFSGEVPWVDASGSWHDSGWPSCLPRRAETRITFGGATVYGPTGTGSARILWVDCRTAP